MLNCYERGYILIEISGNLETKFDLLQYPVRLWIKSRPWAVSFLVHSCWPPSRSALIYGRIIKSLNWLYSKQGREDQALKPRHTILLSRCLKIISTKWEGWKSSGYLDDIKETVVTICRKYLGNKKKRRIPRNITFRGSQKDQSTGSILIMSG